MTEEESAAHAAMESALGLVEGVNALADTMTAMKTALEDRGWSTPMSEQVGAAFGTVMFSQIGAK